VDNLALKILNYDISIRIMKRYRSSVNSRKVESAKEARLKLDEIKALLKTGRMSYDDAKKVAYKPLQLLNEGMAVIAREHGMKERKTGFGSYMR